MADGRAAVPAVSANLPLSALLSQALVASTIELDNESEHHMSHRATQRGGYPDGS